MTEANYFAYMTQKHVTWVHGTKTHDGNPHYKIPYEKVTTSVKEKYPRSVQVDSSHEDQVDSSYEDAAELAEDMTWLDYVSPVDRDIGHIIVFD